MVGLGFPWLINTVRSSFPCTPTRGFSSTCQVRRYQASRRISTLPRSIKCRGVPCYQAFIFLYVYLLHAFM